MSTWGEVFLGVIAVATLATAIVQVGVLIAAARLARRLEQLSASVEDQIKPVFAHLDVIGRDVSRATQLAGAQMERVDALFGDTVVRLEQTMDTVQRAVSIPAREGTALLAGFRAIVGALRDGAIRHGQRPRGRGEDEDALFI